MFTISVFICWLCTVEANHNVVKSTASDVGKSDKILSRKRRYLIFPKGSSIQLGKRVTINGFRFFSFFVQINDPFRFLFFLHILVYDSVVTIPDYTIYVVTGVTCALAWGLPDQPIYPEDDLMHRYEDGGLPGIQYRNDVNVTENVPVTKPTRAPSSKTATKIDNRTLMNLIRLFYSSARQTSHPNVSSLMPNYPNAFGGNYYHWNASLPNKASNRITFSNGPSKTNYYDTHPPTALSQSHAAIDYVNRNANNPFKKYMADTYFEPWIGAAWKMQTTKKFVKNELLTIFHCEIY